MKRNPFRLLGKKSDRITKLYPNGECVVYRQRINKIKHVDRTFKRKLDVFDWGYARLLMLHREAFLVAALFMGLSLVRNFDIVANPFIWASESEHRELSIIATACGVDRSDYVRPLVKRATRYGGNGITRQGARTVRCAAYLMQKRYGRGRLTFATVTLPKMPIESAAIVHERWHEVVEAYRLGIRRELQKTGLSGEIITVSEIQEKRHKKTGVPMLHLHSIWVGRLPYGGWAVSTERHDHIWRKAVRAVLPDIPISFKSAANLQEVHTSAGNYLGKYMTKGAASVNTLKEQGFADWLPRQWWNMSRELSRRVKAETLITSRVSEDLLAAAASDDKSVWDFVGHVTIDIGQKQDYWLASYGRLTQEFAEYIRLTEGLPSLTGCDTLQEYKDSERSKGGYPWGHSEKNLLDWPVGQLVER